ncbi:MAG: YgjV family protein [Christensenellales bacterium]
MDIKFLIAQVLGFCALLISIISIPQKTKNRYILFYIIQNVFSGIQYILLGKTIAFILCLICIFRLIVYRYRNYYTKSLNIFILVFFILVNLIFSIITYTTWWDIFPAIASMLVCYTIWQEKILIIRLGCILSKILWGIYAIISLAYFSFIMDIVIILWTIFVIIRDKRNNSIKNL